MAVEATLDDGVDIVTHEYDRRCPHCKDRGEAVKPKLTWIPHFAIFKSFWKSKYRYDGTLWALTGIALMFTTLCTGAIALICPYQAITTHTWPYIVATFALPLLVIPCLVYWIIQCFRKADKTHEEWVKSERG